MDKKENEKGAKFLREAKKNKISIDVTKKKMSKIVLDGIKKHDFDLANFFLCVEFDIKIV